MNDVSSDAIAAAFERAESEGRAALIPFITAGDPADVPTVDVLRALATGGADIIELGIPFSDPVADGPTIQESSQRALERGTTLVDALDAVAEFRCDHETPLVLFTYYNPILAIGEERFAKRASEAGANGALVVDLTFEERAPLAFVFEPVGMHIISLLSPTTSEARMATIAEASSGFLYYVSMTGVTGSRLSAFDAVSERVAQLKAVSNGLPVAVGFGVQTPEDAKSVAQFADAVVVGSELVRRLHEAKSDAPEVARAFMAELRAAVSK